YQYEGLHNPDAIRVLKLLPGGFGSPLKCEILEVRKSEDPSFEALSYTWGEPVFPCIVQDAKSNTVIRITENLSDALNGLRYEATERILWIDQICINQMDLPEKSHQVANMGDIYRIATKTLVWLGKDDE
ncbi:heterokaryon incompatibility protein-domain-containing protein, partial [Tricladium varicosporioides]